MQDLEEGSCSSDAYTGSDDDDVDKEYSTDNDIHDDDGSYDSGEDDIEEDLDDNSDHYSDGSEHDSKINTNVKDDKVLPSSNWSLIIVSIPKCCRLGILHAGIGRSFKTNVTFL